MVCSFLVTRLNLILGTLVQNRKSTSRKPRKKRGTVECELSRGSEDSLDGPDELHALTGWIIGAAIKVHTILGPGLLEHAYSACLSYELRKAGFSVLSEIPLALQYEDLTIGGAYRIDALVEDTVIVEVKAIEKVLPVHHAQLLTYLKLSQKKVGLLLNFNVKILPNGITRIVNNL